MIFHRVQITAMVDIFLKHHQLQHHPLIINNDQISITIHRPAVRIRFTHEHERTVTNSTVIQSSTVDIQHCHLERWLYHRQADEIMIMMTMEMNRLFIRQQRMFYQTVDRFLFRHRRNVMVHRHRSHVIQL